MKFNDKNMYGMNVAWEDFNAFLMSSLLMSSELVQNGKIRRELLRGTKSNQADTLYDAADSYLGQKRYKDAKLCLFEIERLACWEEDETLQPATYSLLASLYFNMEVLAHSQKKFKERDFIKAKEYAEKACRCKVPNSGVARRTQTGAWQVLFCIAVLCGDVLGACNIRAKHNLAFLSYRQSSPFDDKNNWYVCNEISEVFIESEYHALMKVHLYENPENFDDLYQLHIENEASYNYTEALAFAATFVENNIVRTSILYNNLFKYLNEYTTDFQTYFFNQCEKLAAIMYSKDTGEIKRMLQALDKLKEDNYDLFKEMSTQEIVIGQYIALRGYALLELEDYKGLIDYANNLTTDEYNEQIAYCVSCAYAQLGDFEKAERAAAASLSVETDVLKIYSLAKLYYNQEKYEKAYSMYVWAKEQIEQKIKKGEKTDGPKNIPSINYPSVYMQAKIYSELIDTLLMLNDYVEVKKAYDKYCGIRGVKDKQEVLLRIESKKVLFDSKQEIDKEKHLLEIEVVRKDKTIQDMIELQKHWYSDLQKCQMFGEDVVVTDEMWNECSMDSKMDLVIQKVRNHLNLMGSERYDIELEKVKARYPNMTEQAQKYLASAEQMQKVFLNNPLIDCAPVLVEFARVFEECLWYYIENTTHYQNAAKEQLKNHYRTLGTAGYIIKHYQGPLRRYATLVHQITEMRNESAHAYLSKEPEIRTIRQIIWVESNNLLDALMI